MPRRVRLLRTVVVLGLIGTAGVWLGGRSAPRRPTASARVSERPLARAAPGDSFVRAGSDPSVLPGPLLIADRGNNRLLVVSPTGQTLWEFPRPGDLAPGQTFRVPDDVFYTPDGRQIVATQEDDFVVSIIDVAAHRIVWRYGTPGVHGSRRGLLWNPDDGIMLPGGTIILADIKNCRLLVLDVARGSLAKQLGASHRCAHRPPLRFGSPNGMFPTGNGRLLVTEIRHDWVDEIDLNGNVYFSVHPPKVRYPSDTNLVAPGRYLTVDYSKPGQIVEFDRTGKALWRFAPRGPDALSRPSLAVPLPNGDVLCNDDFNHRVVVVDPRTDRIVWQYGQTGKLGRGPGFLALPDGVDLAPPFQLVDRLPG